MKSKKILFELLAKHFNKTNVQIGKHSISDETYGKRSMIYFFSINNEWGVSRKQFEDLLSGWGFSVNRNYWVGRDATEVQVSYFKGRNWDE